MMRRWTTLPLRQRLTLVFAVGTAVTLAACQHAAKLGCRHALLNATGMGEPVYRRIGFRDRNVGETVLP